ncbi:MAG: PEGA domain-containing protein [Ignavibacteriae bacterium]|nr:PEGA domain-containing protein [Ignavibacteriota bacterium]
MKKILILVFIAILGITFTSCDDTATDPVPVVETGNLVVTSTPAGASIALNKTGTGEVTPHTFADQDVAVYEVTLTLDNYADTTLFVDVLNGQDATVNVVLTPQSTVFSTPVRIWETTGTTADQPSGLVLSSGAAQSSSSADIDIYYYSSSDGSTYLVQSANANNSAKRATYFKVSSSTNLNDGVDSGVKNSTWASAMGDRETNYAFLYDADSHYSKLKIVNFGGGTGPGDPSWVEVSWIYNKAKDSVVF